NNQPTFSGADIARISTSVNEVVRRMSSYLFPPVIQLETSVDESQSGAKVGMAVLMLPGIIMMSLLFIASGLSEDLWRECQQGTLRRAATTPRAIVVHLAGKLLAGLLVIAACTLILLLVGMPYAGAPLTKIASAVTWSVISGTFLVLLMMPIQ